MPETPASIATLLRSALRSGEARELRQAAAPEIHWTGAAGEAALGEAGEVLARCAAMGFGPGAVIEETFTFPSAVVFGLRSAPPATAADAVPAPSDTTTYWVFGLAEGRIAAICTHDERHAALAAAEPYLAASPAARLR